VHDPSSGTHALGGALHVPFTQLLEQQSALTVHAPAVAVHAVWQVFVVALHVPPQQSAFAVHEAPSFLQVPAPCKQRGGFTVSSQIPEQHPFCGPLLHVSPVGRHVVFAESSVHLLSAPQMFEQHSPFCVQSSPSTVHSAPPHFPELQSRLQQSSAFVQLAPSALQKLSHCVTPACPCTGSHMPLQHVSFFGSHEVVGASHVPASTQKPLAHRPLQQSLVVVHVAPFASQAEPTHFPSEPHAFEQQSIFVEHVPPLG
jgi:hypothetical protein